MADTLASVALGVAGFFLPGIFKAFVTRKRTMTLGAREAKDAFIYDSLFDPLSMRRWFDQPKEMKEQEEADGSEVERKNGSRRCRLSDCKVLIFPVTLALLTQVTLVMLQFASTQEIVGQVGVEGPGVSLSISPMPSEEAMMNPRRSACRPTQTGHESLSTITTCYSTYFQLIGFQELRNEKYFFRVTRTFATVNEGNMTDFGFQLRASWYTRSMGIVPRIITRSGQEAYVAINEDNITASNENFFDFVDNYLFPDRDCSRSEITKSRNTDWQYNWDLVFDCSGSQGGQAPSDNFNSFSAILADSFQSLVGTSLYFAPHDDFGIAVADLNNTEVEYSTSLERVLSDWAIISILVIILLLKLLTDVIFGEDVLYKTTILVDELSAQESNETRQFTTLIRAQGKLKFEGGTYLSNSSCVPPSSEPDCGPKTDHEPPDDEHFDRHVDATSEPSENHGEKVVRYSNDASPAVSRTDRMTQENESITTPFSSNVYQMLMNSNAQQSFNC